MNFILTNLPDSPEVERAAWVKMALMVPQVNSAREAQAALQAAVGMLVKNEEEACQWQERGVRLLAINLDTLLAPAYREFLANAGQVGKGTESC